MTRITAQDCRRTAPSGAPGVPVDYDPARVQHFDTRGQCASRWQEIWGDKVDVQIGGELCTLYLEYCGHAFGHTARHRNFLKDS